MKKERNPWKDKNRLNSKLFNRFKAFNEKQKNTYEHKRIIVEQTVKSKEKAGYWKANQANKFIGRGTRSSDFSKGISKGFVQTLEKVAFRNFEKFPLEIPPEKSDDRAPLPIQSTRFSMY